MGKYGEKMEKFDVVIVGGGISGLVAANELCRLSSPLCRILILERGNTYQNRLNSDSPNLLEGLGGAGTVGGGKLCFPPASGEIWGKTSFRYIHDFIPLMKHYFSPFTPQRIYDSSCTGTNCDFNHHYYEKLYSSQLLSKEDMARFVQGLIDQALRNQVVIRTNSCLTDYVNCNDGKLLSYTDSDGRICKIHTRHLVLACGRSMAKELPVLLPSAYVVQQPTDLGIRLVFPLQKGGKFSRIGQDVKLKANYGDVLVRSFCVCSGGELAKIHYHGQIYYDGHFGDQISSTVNLGILARSSGCIGTDAAIQYLRSYQDMVDEEITLSWFLNHWSNLAKTEEHRKIFEAIARFANSLLISGQLSAEADEIRVVMPSIDHFNPIVKTNENFRTPDPRIWVIGDAAGISRGFIQSFWSGHCAAMELATELSSEKDFALWG